MTLALAFACLLSLPQAPSAPEPNAQQLDAHVARLLGEHSIPALQLAVVHRGKVVAERAYGQASLELAVPLTSDHVFPVASITKVFTATTVLQLVQERKLTLDQAIGELLPDLPAAWRPVKVRQLLSHTSGLPDVIVDPIRGTWIAPTREAALTKAGDLPMQAPPGAAWSYNQTNFLLLGMLIERVTGTPFQEAIAARVLQPLGLEATSWGDSTELVARRVTWYSAIEWRDGKPRRSKQPHPAQVEYPTWIRTAAGLNTNARELAAFVEAVARGKLLGDEARRSMWTAVSLASGEVFRMDGTLGVGLGWLVDDRQGHRAIGGTGGACVAFRHWVEDELTVVVLTNLQGIDPDAIVEGIGGLWIPDLAKR